MNDAINVTQPYEAPRIEDRSSLDTPLVALTSNIDASAAFRAL
jgi:hypothetical protein